MEFYEADHIQIAEAMLKYGGGFIQALATCIVRADLDNLRKLHDALPEYFEEYAKVFNERMKGTIR